MRTTVARGEKSQKNPMAEWDAGRTPRHQDNRLSVLKVDLGGASHSWRVSAFGYLCFLNDPVMFKNQGHSFQG